MSPLPTVEATTGGYVKDHRGRRFNVPKRAIAHLIGPFGVPAACIERLNVNAVLELVTGPPPGYGAGGERTHDAPMPIGGPRTQYLFRGRRWRHVMGLPNPMDSNRPHRIAWGVMLVHARRSARGAALAMGLPSWLVELMVFESEAVIEPVIKLRGKMGGRPLREADVAASDAQSPHLDFDGMQLLISLSPQPVKSTKWFSGTYLPVTDAVAQCKAADPSWSNKKIPAGNRHLREAAATLLQPAAELEAQMTHIMLSPGEGLATWGFCVHAGADNSAGVWRCMLFMTGRLPRGHRYNSDVQHLPFTVGRDLWGCDALTRHMALQHRALAPWRHFRDDAELAAQIQRDCKKGRISYD